jgi:hypothetical protein
MAKRYYNLERETKDYLESCDNLNIAPFTTTSVINNYIIFRKAFSKNPIIYDPRINKNYFSNLEVWLDASDGNTLYDNNVGGSIVLPDGTIGRWEDKSGKGRNVLNTTLAQRPVKKINVQNNLSSVFFDGVSLKGLSSANDLTLFTKSIFCVVSYPFSNTWIQSYQGIFTAGNNETVIAITTGQNYIYPSVTGATETKRYINNIQTNILLPATSLKTIYTEISNPIRGFITVGRDRSFTNRSWNGYISEILVFSVNLTIADMESIEFYISKKWGCY